MSDSYLDRYRRGDREGVWRDLLALGPGVREEPILGDARAVARETMGRAAHNLGLIVDRLRDLEYRFAFPDEIWRRPDEESRSLLEDLERRCGPLPLSLRAWHEVVGTVNLMGAHPMLSMYSELDWGGSDQFWDRRWYTDPLVISAAEFEGNVDDDWFDEGDVRHLAPPFILWLAPDAIHKANNSGGEGMSVHLPAPAADVVLRGADWPGVPFVSYLRTCFAWGGFPGFVHRSPDPMGSRPGDITPFLPVLAALRQDLLPL